MTAEVERLREELLSRDARLRRLAEVVELLREMWRHRNGGSALSSSWDRRVTEVLETNGPT